MLRTSHRSIRAKLPALAALLTMFGACTTTNAPSLAPPTGSYFPIKPCYFDVLFDAHLRAMAEPAMTAVATRANKAFRFTLLPSFDRPVMVRIESRADGFVLEAIVLSGAGGYEPGVVVERVARSLTDAEWRSIEQGAERIGFWELEHEISLDFDGSSWLLEGVQGDDYHCFEQNSPEPGPGDGFRRLCLAFMELSDLGSSVGRSSRLARTFP